MLKFSIKVLQFVDVNGKLREIGLLSVLEQYQFRQKLLSLYDYVAELTGDTSASYLLGNDLLFCQHVEGILQLFNLNLADVPVEGVVEFLFEHEDNSGIHHNSGLLVEMNFPDYSERKDDEVDFAETFNAETSMVDTLAALLTIEGSLKDVLTVANQFDPETLAQVLKVKADYERLANRTPEQQAQDRSKEVVERLKAKEEANSDPNDFLNALKNG